MNNNNDIPVVLFAFNRHEQLKKTLDCLKNNSIPKLYVFIDGPRNSADEDDIKKVIKLVNKINWTSVQKIIRKKNLGLSRSIQTGLNRVFSQNESAIIIEDDICVAPSFYAYMIKALETYRNNKNIAGITGLRYPFSRMHLDRIKQDVFMAPRFSSWGWATWRDCWEKIEFDREDLQNMVLNTCPDLKSAGDDIEVSYNEYLAGRLKGCWDVKYAVNMVVSKTYFIWPKFNLVDNIDIGGGTHYSDDKPNWRLDWELPGKTKFIMHSDIEPNNLIIRDFLKFFKIKRRIINFAHVKYQLKNILQNMLSFLGYEIRRKK